MLPGCRLMLWPLPSIGRPLAVLEPERGLFMGEAKGVEVRAE